MKDDISSSVAPLTTAELTAAATSSPTSTDGTATASLVCSGDGSSGNRVEVLYVRESGRADRYGQYLASFRSWADGIETMVSASAAQTGGSRHVRFVTDNCNITVRNVVVPSGATSSYGRSVDALKAAGYNRKDRKYVMFVDATVLCGIAGYVIDSRSEQANGNNYGPSFARLDSGCWSSGTATHELVHTLGAVFSGAPHATPNGHCTDDYDVMCYDDDGSGSVFMRIVCSDRIGDSRLDCNHDDYFSTNPAAGSWLATHWNTANSQFLFADGSGGGSGGGGTSSGTGQVRSGISGKCLDVDGARTANGTHVQLWTCNTSTAQVWTASSDGTLRAVGKCLDANARGTANGTMLQIYDCGGGANQKWEAYNGGYRNPVSGRCIDDPGYSTTDGTQLVLWDCSGGANQKWTQPGA